MNLTDLCKKRRLKVWIGLVLRKHVKNENYKVQVIFFFLLLLQSKLSNKNIESTLRSPRMQDVTGPWKKLNKEVDVWISFPNMFIPSGLKEELDLSCFDDNKSHTPQSVPLANMAQHLHALIWLLEVVLLAGSKHSISVHQPAALTASMGESVTLNCSCQGRGLFRFTSQWHLYRGNTSVGTWNGSEDKGALKPADQKEKASVRHHGNTTSSLLITDLQTSDGGTYVCTLKALLPPPTQTGKGNGTLLTVLAPPRVRLSSSPAHKPPLALMVTCAVSEFYPASINVTLSTTCGGLQGLENSTPVLNRDETYNTTRRALLTTAGCTDGAEVTCSVQHETGERSRSIGIAQVKNEDPPHHQFLLITCSAAGVVLVSGVILILFICKSKSHRCCSGCARRSSSLTTERGNGLVSASHLGERHEDYPDIVYTEPSFQRTGIQRELPSMDYHTEYSVLRHE